MGGRKRAQRDAIVLHRSTPNRDDAKMSNKVLGADWMPLGDFAESVDKHPRTIKRWAHGPDGLPTARQGNEELVHIPSYQEWLLSRLRKRNPRRVA